MKAPISWLREYVALPDTLAAHALATELIGYGHEVEQIEAAGADVVGPVVVGRVLDVEKNEQQNGKLINWCHVDVGEHNDPKTGTEASSAARTTSSPATLSSSPCLVRCCPETSPSRPARRTDTSPTG